VLTAACGLCSALVPTYWWLLGARALSGFTLSAAPVAFTWMLEASGHCGKALPALLASTPPHQQTDSISVRMRWAARMGAAFRAVLPGGAGVLGCCLHTHAGLVGVRDWLTVAC
jgi:hypothetical protein